MRHKQKKRFPFFTLPMPKFMRADLKKMDDFVVMLRITPKITLFHYQERILFLIIFLLYSFVMLVEIVSIALNVSFPAFLRFLMRNGSAIIASLRGVPIPLAQQVGVLSFWALIFLLVGAAWIVSQTRRAFRSVRGLYRLHTMTPQQRSAFSLETFLQISLPMWLSPSITYEPTPEELLTLLRERERARAGQTQAMAEEVAREENGDEEQKETPSFRSILTLTDRLSFTLLGPNGKQFTMPLSDAVASLVGFLATRESGAWTAKEELFAKHLYSQGQENLFTRHRERTNAQIIARAQKEGFLPQPPTKQEPKETSLTDAPSPSTQDEHDAERVIDDESPRSEARTEETINLFENKIQSGVSSWRLTPRCSIEVFPFLTTFYQKVLRAQALPEDPAILNMEEVRQGCDRLMKEYGIGFLAEHIKGNNPLWAWALPLYRHYREQCLDILTYAIVRESEALAMLTELRDKHAAIEAIAQLHGWRAIVATGLDLKDRGIFSEEDIVTCLSYYGQMRKRADAKEIYQRYHELRSRIDPSYEPGKDLQMIVDEVMYQKKNTTRSHNIVKNDW